MVTLRVQEVLDAFNDSISPISLGILTDEHGIVFGSGEADVKGIGCVWKADSKAIAAANEQGLNLIVSHESIGHAHYPSTAWVDFPEDSEPVPLKIRMELLEKNQMNVIRIHSPWDGLDEDGVADQAVKALGIKGVKVHAEQKFFKVHQLPEQITVCQLTEYAKKGLRFEGCRLFGDGDKLISRFCFLIGGFGANQPQSIQAALEMGAEALILGETKEYIILNSLEMGMPVIETSHSISEIPAIRRQAEMLGQRYPDIPVKYIPSSVIGFGGLGV